MPIEAQRVSRWSNRRPGRAIIPELFYNGKYRRHLGILEALAYDRFLCGKYLGALFGTNRIAMGRTLDDLMALPHDYIKICDYQLQNIAGFQSNMRQFELTQKGIDIVREHFGFSPVPPTSPSSIQHQIMGDHFMASLRVGAKQSAVAGKDDKGNDIHRFHITTWQKLIANDNTPRKTRETAVPTEIPLGGTVRTETGKQVPHVIRTDREAFVISDRRNGVFYPIAGIESGRGTETQKPRDTTHTTRSHSTAYGKFEDIITAFREEIIEDMFDWHTAHFIFIEHQPGRIDTMLKLWAEMTKRNREFRPRVWFKLWHSYAATYEATGDALTTPFHTLSEDGQITTFSMVS